MRKQDAGAKKAGMLKMRRLSYEISENTQKAQNLDHLEGR